jgi:hypothetical protein
MSNIFLTFCFLTNSFSSHTIFCVSFTQALGEVSHTLFVWNVKQCSLIELLYSQTIYHKIGKDYYSIILWGIFGRQDINLDNNRPEEMSSKMKKTPYPIFGEENLHTTCEKDNR